MPPWFMDIESATDTEAKSNGTPPASRTAAQAWRANSPSSALHGVTRPSVEATPTKGLARSASDSPSPRRKARCGARSRPSTVMREGSFFVFTHDFLDVPAVGKAELRRARRARRLRHRVHDRLDLRVRVERHRAARGVFHGIPHLLRGNGNAGEKEGSSCAEFFPGDCRSVNESLHHPRDRDAGHRRIGPHRADVVAAGERLA